MTGNYMRTNYKNLGDSEIQHAWQLHFQCSPLDAVSQAQREPPAPQPDDREEDEHWDKGGRGSRANKLGGDDDRHHGLKSFERVQIPEIMHHKTHEIKAPTSKQVFKQGEGFVKVKLKKEEQDAERQRLVALAHLENPDMGRISRF